MYQEITHSFTSKKSLLRTIQNDNIVYYWFSLLFLNKSLRATLSQNKNTALSYKEFIASLYFRFILVFFLALFASAMLFHVFSDIYWAVLLPVIALYLSAQKKGFKAFCNIFEEFINQNFDSDSLQKKTLYQIGEFYGDRYAIHSLVDTLQRNIKTYTYFFGISFVFLVFIYPINTLVTCLGLLTTVLIIRIYFNTFSLLRHLQNNK
ncbi:MAG: hypothetical protein A2Y03_06265 [Omnitrophica WOR_2 bacterium GWF2_38_59]|nr:MAG: hypothetical protein A2Y03_06265 [Omnitrophica WOR_2 bacterium GWF2_38_59]OGX49917.1 MAG: hypothetical protein A2243_11260 [Omnitrophica WOR_2 bacterium RIFOXYA2_FULL_38_17]OGX51149.1 MAG: hypothetical protein A2267_06475 [Omnitrophica WOR_2 bacterium RIFOXYA12_FULL_38_10]OGX55145.1 MAG: hypothetical protein A2306_02685 [Omnitrophica WOR_2 bacterium RIFOXYB2_FULL_38_16]OGX57273.1 MAG: hypothetical protein A2447_09985 [Omnitrophica WOR_2 bacterium RIFOXYC2_FULL_38_12]HBG61198.1 hypothet